VAASCTLSAGSCTTDFTGKTTGTATITGTYSGDSSHNGSSGTSNVIIATSGNGNHNGNGNGNGGNTKTCDEGKSHDADPRGNAYGFFKNKLGTTIALVKAMAANDPAFNLHHVTDIDNDTAHGLHSHIHDPGDHDSSCASAEEEHDKA